MQDCNRHSSSGFSPPLRFENSEAIVLELKEHILYGGFFAKNLPEAK